jgi:hypothetical protein
MIVHKPKRIEIWGGAIGYEEPVPDAKTAAVKKAIDTGLDAFEHHKEALLDHLRSPSERGSKSQPFDETSAWRHLTTLARYYFWEARVREEILPPSERRRRLRAFEKATSKVRAVADKAMQTDVGDALFSAWCEANVRYDLVPTIADE